jgi:cytoskeletal protein CcmA (bactofilin family)
MSGSSTLRGIDTLIARGCRIEGKLVFTGGLRIDGQVCGDVRTDLPGQGYLALSRSGQVSGDIHAGQVMIDGIVTGNLHIGGRVELLSRARIIGDIHYVSLSMQPGATVTGQLCPNGEAGTHPGISPEPLLKLA